MIFLEKNCPADQHVRQNATKKTYTEVFVLVFFGDGDVGAAGLELVLLDLAQQLPVDAEEHLKAALLDVVVTDPELKQRRTR